jgi:hypothetical protein
MPPEATTASYFLIFCYMAEKRTFKLEITMAPLDTGFWNYVAYVRPNRTLKICNFCLFITNFMEQGLAWETDKISAV